MPIIEEVFSSVGEEETSQHMFGTNDELNLSVLWFDEKLIGFSSYREIPFSSGIITQRVGTVIANAHRGHGLYTTFLRASLSERSCGMFLTTQNPQVLRGVIASELFKEVYPNLDGEAAPDHVRKVLQEASPFAHEIDFESLRIPNRYPMPLYAEFQATRCPAVNRLFRGNFGPTDAIVVVGLV